MDHRQATARTARRAARLGAALVGVLLLAGCGVDLPWAGSDDEASDDAAEATPPSAFERRLLFITEPTGDSIRAALIDYVVHHDSVRTQRVARVLATDADGWRDFFRTAWETEPMREPWRILPHDELRVLVDGSGEIETLIVGDDSLRFLPGPTLAEYSPDAASQFQLRDAELHIGGDRVRGLALDLQLARPLDAAGTDADALRRRAMSPPADSDTVAGAAPAAAADVRADALLVDGAGFRLVVDRAATGSRVWLQHPQWQDVWSGARLVPSEYGLAQPAGRTVPILWHLVRADGDTAAELRVSGRDYARTTPGGGVYGVALVRGWIELSGERRDLRGLLRHGSE